jgi:hypothetical protein
LLADGVIPSNHVTEIESRIRALDESTDLRAIWASL